jgi:hypothetical protein
MQPQRGKWLWKSPDSPMRQWLLLKFGLQHIYLMHDILNWLLIPPASDCDDVELRQSVP